VPPITVARNLTSDDVQQVLTDRFIERGPPDYIHSDNGGEFTAKVVRNWFEWIGVRTPFIERGSPWENGYIESFTRTWANSLITHGSPLGVRPGAVAVTNGCTSK
jgi:transposase InsO family protein